MIIEIGGLAILIILTLMGITQEVKIAAILGTVLFSLIFLGIDIYCLLCIITQYKLLQYSPPPYSVII
uniref:TSA: Tityus bahiensis Tbah01512 mRNA sequence n=1 Tax=Tityus bahiensis TaxID=50343 RepID=A0A0C9S397_TITBA